MKKSSPRPAPIVLFVDRALGAEDVPNALKGAGATIEIHQDHFVDTTDDREWIEDVTKRGWAILTKDKRIKRNRLERMTLEGAGAAAFILTAGDISGADMAAAFVRALPRIQKILDKFTRPIIATIGPGGGVTLLVGERRGGVRKEE